MNLSRVVLVGCALSILICPAEIAAQEAPKRFEAGVSFVTASLRELDARDTGVSGRVGWRPTAILGVEGEVAFYPGDAGEGPAVSASRTEAAFGLTAGSRRGRLRPFGRFRTGVLRLAAAPAPFACILIFPPPLSCSLASGRSLFMLDAGGGVEFDVSPDMFVRVDAGDRIVRYPGPAISRERVVQDDDFSGHDFRLAAGLGWRF